MWNVACCKQTLQGVQYHRQNPSQPVSLHPSNLYPRHCVPYASPSRWQLQTTTVIGCSLGGHLLSLGTIHLYRHLFWLHCSSPYTASVSCLLVSLAAHTIRGFSTMPVYWCCQMLCECQQSLLLLVFSLLTLSLWSARERRFDLYRIVLAWNPFVAGVIAGQLYFAYDSAILLQILCLRRTKALSLANYYNQ